MFPWLPSYPYPPSREGFWSPRTATLDWCEEDYYASYYSAEIVNTVTNLIFVMLAYRGIRNCIDNGHDHIFLVTFVGYAIVGTGSFMFHASLSYPMQLVDELSMIYTTCIMNYATFSYKKSRPYRIGLGLFLTALAAFITLYYHYLQDPAFHQNMYALLTAVVLLRAMWVMETNLRPRFRNKGVPGEGQNGSLSLSSTAEQERRDRRDEKILRTMWVMIAYGLSVFLGGFAIWTLDNKFCGALRTWRQEVGLPWGILSEGHGWWHIMTGIGAYFYITWGIWLRHCLNGRQDEFELRWPRAMTSLPMVYKKKALPNGSAKVANSKPVR